MAQSLTSSQYLKFAYDLYSELETSEINLMYEGAVTPETSLSFTAMTEQNLSRLGEPSSVIRKVFNVLVESVQNISRHADLLSDDPAELRRGIVAVSHSDKVYNVVTGNVVRSTKKPILMSKIDLVNSLDKTGLSELYKQQIKEGSISDKGGAGLGFIDIAKKSGNKIAYKFFDMDPDFLFFMMVATITRKQ